MSSSTLTRIQTQMNFYGYPLLLVWGDLGNLFILILFNRHKHNACSIYLVNSAVANILYLTIGGFFRVFSTSYNDGTVGALISCKMSNFVPGYLGQVTKTLLIFACIDRYMVTSSRASFRAFSTPRRAKYLTFFIYAFWAVGTSHIALWMTISNGQCGAAGIYVTAFAIYAVLFIGLIPTSTLCLFATLTYRNMKQLHTRIHPRAPDANYGHHSIKRRDRDLLVVVMAEVVIYMVTTIPLTLAHCQRMVAHFAMPMKSVQYVQAELFAVNIAFLLVFVFSAIPFYTYFTVSASFRQEFRQLILVAYRKMRHLTTNDDVSRIPTQRDTPV